MSEHYSSSIIPIGGRIKAAAVGMDMFHAQAPELDTRIREMQQKPPFPILKAFFPHDAIKIKQFLRQLGLYRPTLKTDQGMGGTFLPFSIDSNKEQSDLTPSYIIDTQGVALPEYHYSHDHDEVRRVQRMFLHNKLRETASALGLIESRRANKGRTPYFFIQPSRADTERVFGKDVTVLVENETNRVVEKSIAQAEEQELRETGATKNANLLYVQPDAYVLSSGQVQIERVNTPDLGMFLDQMDVPCENLQRVRTIVNGLTRSIVASITKGTSAKELHLITRDEVLSKREDMLEQAEMAVFIRLLDDYGINAIPHALGDINNLPKRSTAILMNINYTAESARDLMKRHSKGEIECYPNPYVQRELLTATGLKETTLDPRYRNMFLELASSLPKNENAIVTKIQRLRSILEKCGFDQPVLHAMVSQECIPILRDSSHSWRAFATRCKRYSQEEIKFRAIPLSPEDSLLKSETGNHMHVYRFAALMNHD